MPVDTTRKATCWSVTINNPIAADEEAIAQARQKGWKVEGQLERGKEGTPHYQLMVKTPSIRFSALKNQFHRAHIEPAKSSKALETYVHKEDTREGHLAIESDRYPSLQKFWTLFADWIEARDEMLAKETWKPDRWLQRFDMFVEHAILDGYIVETIAVNPQTRACIKKYGRSIVIRAKQRGQTDRQTDEISVSGTTITEDGDVQEAQVPESSEDEETSAAWACREERT